MLRALPDLIQAAFVTLEVAALSMLIGVVLGLALAMARDFTAPAAAPARWLAVAWVALARNTPGAVPALFLRLRARRLGGSTCRRWPLCSPG
ncbi:hypothetical protein ACFOHS_21955 [Jhaorihella thermophila]